MIFRQAGTVDITNIQSVRNSVKENVLSNPALVSDADVEEYLNKRGKGWVCFDGANMVGFCIADLVDDNIWALFVLPEFEGKGIGTHLHKLMLDWYFSNNKNEVWLSTEAGSRAEAFYRKAGYTEAGPYGKNEIKFTMTQERWIAMATKCNPEKK